MFALSVQIYKNGERILEATIKDVAKHAGVSVATISRVLNNSSVVAPETAEKVNKAIKELNYKPNFLGRNLRKRETNVILALVPSTEQTYYSEILHGMQIEALNHGYDVFMSMTNSYAPHEERLLGMLRNRTVDAAILMGTVLDDKTLNELADQYCIALCCEPRQGSDILTVMIDNEKAAYDAVKYLASIGHKKIGMVSTTVRAPSSVEREEGYMRALKDCGLEFDERYLFRDTYDYTSGMKAAEYFNRMENKPTAVFAVSDLLAAGFIKKATEFGINIGREFSVIGFDNISMTEMYNPSISTVEQPCFEIGKMVAKLVIENISGKNNSGRIFLDHKLVFRQSTERK